MDLLTARARLERLVQWDIDPALTVDEVDDLLAVARRRDSAGNGPSNTTDAGTWAASTEFLAGTIIRVASTPVRYWRCVTTGISHAVEPSWPNLAGYPVIDKWSFLDGFVVWEDAGSDWTPTWDLDAAAADGWMTKAAKAAGRFDFAEDGQQFTRSQIISHCRAMAESYRRGAAATLTTA